MNIRIKSGNPKSKTDLIESIKQKFNNSPRIIKKITRQAQILTENDIKNFREEFAKNSKSKIKQVINYYYLLSWSN